MAYFLGCNVNIYWQYTEEMGCGWVCYRHSINAKTTAPAVLIQCIGKFINNEYRYHCEPIVDVPKLVFNCFCAEIIEFLCNF